MTIPEILKELEPYTGKFPMKAMKAAIEQREAITGELLHVVEAVAENPQEYARRRDYQVHLFALFLLAQFREKRAFPAIVKMFSWPGETPFDLVGDTVTEGLSQILASVYDGNPALLHGLVESEQVNEYVRSAVLDSFPVGLIPRSLLRLCLVVRMGDGKSLHPQAAQCVRADVSHCLCGEISKGGDERGCGRGADSGVVE
jgi:hypothetical protein